jgi:hypothetical protein
MPEALDHTEIVAWSAPRVNIESFPIQDEPEAGACFQYKMSLKGYGMLTMNDQRARNRKIKPELCPQTFCTFPREFSSFARQGL